MLSLVGLTSIILEAAMLKTASFVPPPDPASGALAVAASASDYQGGGHPSQIVSKTHALKRLWLLRDPVGCWVSCDLIQIPGGYGPGRIIDRLSREARRS